MDARTLDLQALRIFKAVADVGSVTRAAAELHYVQSNVTTRLRQLEAELGTALFHRVGGRLVITPAGRTLSGYADRLLRLAQEARCSVAADGTPRGPLTIGSMETTAAARLPRRLAEFHKRHPDVDLGIETGPTAQLVQRVLDCALDAALVGGRVEHPALEGRTVFDEELVLITRRGHPPVAGPLDVGQATLLAFRAGCSYRRMLEDWLASGGAVARRTIEYGTFEGIVGCVAAGMGVSLMPRVLIEQRGLAESVGVHALAPRHGRMQTQMIWRRDAAPLPARDAFLAVLLEPGEQPHAVAAAPAPRRPRRAAGAAAA